MDFGSWNFYFRDGILLLDRPPRWEHGISPSLVYRPHCLFDDLLQHPIHHLTLRGGGHRGLVRSYALELLLVFLRFFPGRPRVKPLFLAKMEPRKGEPGIPF